MKTYKTEVYMDVNTYVGTLIFRVWIYFVVLLNLVKWYIQK